MASAKPETVPARPPRAGRHRVRGTGGADGDDQLARAPGRGRARRPCCRRSRRTAGPPAVCPTISAGRRPRQPGSWPSALRDLGQPRLAGGGEVAGPGGVTAVGPAPPTARPCRSSRQVSQSCGSRRWATRAASAGSCSASQRSLVTVNEALGRPRLLRPPAGPPSSAISSGRLRRGPQVVPEHAGRMTTPASSSRSCRAAARRHRSPRPSSRPPARPAERLPPALRVALGAIRVRRAGSRHHGAVRGLAQQDLGGLCRGVNSSDEHRSPLRTDGLNLPPGIPADDGRPAPARCRAG